MKKKIAILAAILCVLVLGIVGVTWAAEGDMPTVVFDAAAKEFRFLNCSPYTDASGTRAYPNLFKSDAFRGLMPGDSAEQQIKVRVVNAGSNTVKMYLKSENPNEDYAQLLSVGTHPATLTVKFASEATTAPFIPGLKTKSTASGGTLSYTEPISDSTYLGSYSGFSSERDIDVSFHIPKEAGSELQGLTAEVDWVFLAEIIPADPGPGPVTPTPSPELQPVNPRKPSRDVADWKVDLIENHVAYIIGLDDGLIHPEKNITRAEVATIFFRLMTTECRERNWSETNTFTDVPSNAWYNTAISTLFNAGVLNGYPDGSFRPNEPITRAEFVTIAYRIVSAKYPQPNTFTDTQGHWASDAIDSAQTLGLLTGYPDGTFRPGNTISRAEVITICNRVLGRAPDIRYLLDDMIQWPDNQDPDAWYYLDIQEATNTHLHGYSEKDYGDREYWIRLEMNIDWATIESPNYSGTHEIYSSSIDNNIGQ